MITQDRTKVSPDNIYVKDSEDLAVEFCTPKNYLLNLQELMDVSGIID